MSVGDLARYRMVSDPNLSGLISRMQRDGHLTGEADGRDGRSRLITITESGCKLWVEQATPKIHEHHEQVLENFQSTTSRTRCTIC